MATGPAPPPAPPPTPTEDDSYDSIDQLLKLATKALREYFDSCLLFRPAVLPTKLKGHVTGQYRLDNMRIVKHQWDLLFPPNGSASSSEHYDISLLVLLLKNFGNLGEPPPGFKWDELPALTEISEYHDIARFKWYRNKYAHAAPGSVSEKESSRHYLDLAQAILRIVPESNREQYSVEILKDTRYQKVLKDFKKEVEQGYDGVKKYVGTGTAEMKKDISQVKGEIAQLRKNTDAIATGVKKIIEDENPEDLIDFLCENLKTVYKSRFREIRSLSKDDAPTIASVLTKAYKYLVCTPLDVRCGNIGGQWDESKVKTTGEIKSLFSREFNPSRLPILIKADAGVGKTMLLYRLAYDWANGDEDMSRFKLVFLIPLRHVRSKRLEDILCHDLHLVDEKYKPNLKTCIEKRGEEILFLLDGLDEKNEEEWRNCELNTIINKNIQCILCSSRPMEVQSLDVSQFLCVKLLGFSNDTAIEYIHFDESVGDHQRATAEQHLAEYRFNIVFQAFQKVPLFAGLFRYLKGRRGVNFPYTATQLFNQCLTEVLNSYDKRKRLQDSKLPKVTFDHSPLDPTSKVPEDIRRILIFVAELTMKIWEKEGFPIDEAKKVHLSSRDITDIGLFSIVEGGNIFKFRHELFHQYFAGLYLSLNEDKIDGIFEEHSTEIITRSHKLYNAFLFAAGISKKTFQCIVDCLNKRFYQGKELSSPTEALDTWMATDNKPQEHYFIVAFFLELLFEHNNFDDFRLSSNATIPVVCSSDHSVATTLHLLMTKEKGPSEAETETFQRQLVLIDQPTSNMAQINAILDECNCRPDIVHIIFKGAGENLISATLNLEWKQIRAIGFENCPYLVPFNDIAHSFPTIETILYDHKTWETKNIFKASKGLDVKDQAPPQRDAFICLQQLEEPISFQEEELKNSPSAAICIRVGDCDNKDWSRGREECLPKEVTAVCIEQTHHTLEDCQKSDSYLQLYKSPTFVFLDGDCDTLYVVVNQSSVKVIAEHYSQREDVRTINLTRANKECIEDMLRVEWPHVERINFTECGVYTSTYMYIPADKFPMLKSLACDDLTHIEGKPYEGESAVKQDENSNPKDVVQVLAETWKNGCGMCRKSPQKSKQLLVPNPHDEASPGSWLRESVSRVCIHFYKMKDLSLSKYVSRSQLDYLTFLHLHEPAVLTKHKGEGLTKIRIRKRTLTKYKKLMKKYKKKLEKNGESWQATLEFIQPCDLKIVGHDMIRQDIVFSYDEMKDICTNRNKSQALQQKQKEAIRKKLNITTEDGNLKFVDANRDNKDKIGLVSMTFEKVQ